MQKQLVGNKLLALLDDDTLKDRTEAVTVTISTFSMYTFTFYLNSII